MYVTLFLLGVVAGIFVHKYWPEEKKFISDEIAAAKDKFAGK